MNDNIKSNNFKTDKIYLPKIVGKWVLTKRGWVCSICGQVLSDDEHNDYNYIDRYSGLPYYCLKCGEKML